MQATLLQLHATDRSKYNSKIPKIYGCYSVPRLAQVMTIDSLTVRVDHSQADGLLVSGRLTGAAARGWPGESGNIISRFNSIPTSLVLHPSDRSAPVKRHSTTKLILTLQSLRSLLPV